MEKLILDTKKTAKEKVYELNYKKIKTTKHICLIFEALGCRFYQPESNVNINIEKLIKKNLLIEVK